ncbi:MAG: hypothetical protein GXY61_09150 [Lentisphaerae bacterium]|nr:hypothetical protein [Lentisphaerota bacterium]
MPDQTRGVFIRNIKTLHSEFCGAEEQAARLQENQFCETALEFKGSLTHSVQINPQGERMENLIYKIEEMAESLLELGIVGTALLVIIFFLILIISLIPTLFYLRSLHIAFQRCAPENRTHYPAEVWLLLIPFFNIAWHFITVKRLAESQKKEFEQRRLETNNISSSKIIGLAMCTFTLCTIIPFIGLLAAPIGFICWILYWIKLSGNSAMLIKKA